MKNNDINHYSYAQRPFRMVLLAIGFAVLGLLWAGFIWRIIAYSDNHIGFDTNFALIPMIAVLITALKLLAYNIDDKLARAMLLLALISIVALLLLRSFNVLLPYEMWLRLGMPDRPF